MQGAPVKSRENLAPLATSRIRNGHAVLLSLASTFSSGTQLMFKKLQKTKEKIEKGVAVLHGRCEFDLRPNTTENDGSTRQPTSRMVVVNSSVVKDALIRQRSSRQPTRQL
jgi:hypothetical protein